MIFELNKFLTASKFAGLFMVTGLLAFKSLKKGKGSTNQFVLLQSMLDP